MAFTPEDYNPYDFANRRHIGPSPSEMTAMLDVLGVSDLDELIEQTIPAALRQAQPLNFEEPLSERELIFKMRQVAAKNKVFTTMIGQGFYGTVCPPAIQRNILENPAWYTAYTPYQPEISQGRLEALLNFQTVVSDLTGLEVANASLLDEATAAAEAMVMAQRVAKSKARGFFIDENSHPQNIAVMQTRAEPLDIDIIIGAPEELDASTVFGGIFQYPGTYGHIRDFSPQAEQLQAAKAITVIVADPLALTLLKEPLPWVPILLWGLLSDLVCPWDAVARLRPTWHAKRLTSAACPGGSSVYQSMLREILPIASPCKLASSTFGVKRRPLMSAPLRHCWPISPVFMLSFTVQKGLKPLLKPCIAKLFVWLEG